MPKRPVFVCVVLFLVVMSSCISEKDINAISFYDVENTKLEYDENDKCYVLFADIVLLNKNRIKFKLTDFNLQFFWRKETIDVEYNGGSDSVIFRGEKVSIPVKAKLSVDLANQNLLMTAMEVLFGNKNKVRASGSIKIKKLFFSKTIPVNREFSVSL